MFDRSLLSERKLREQVISLVEHARQRLPNNFSIVDIEHCFGLQKVDEALPLGIDGVYIEGESKIIINKEITSQERQQFTLYHELVHHLIRKDADLYSYLHDTYNKNDNFDKTIELICNIGAAEFILPHDNVHELLNAEGFSLRLVPLLCQKRRVSGPAALIQLINCAPNPCYGVICEYGLSPIQTHHYQQTFSHKGPIHNLFILYAMWSLSAKYPLARWTTIPKEHLITLAHLEKRFVKGEDKIPFRSGRDWRVPCEAIFFRNNVYGLFNVTAPPDPQQPKLF